MMDWLHLVAHCSWSGLRKTWRTRVTILSQWGLLRASRVFLRLDTIIFSAIRLVDPDFERHLIRVVSRDRQCVDQCLKAGMYQMAVATHYLTKCRSKSGSTRRIALEIIVSRHRNIRDARRRPHWLSIITLVRQRFRRPLQEQCATRCNHSGLPS